MRAFGPALLCALVASAALAEPPARSILPLPRPGAVVAPDPTPAPVAETAEQGALLRVIRPLPRPVGIEVPLPQLADEVALPLTASLPPPPRPQGLGLAAPDQLASDDQTKTGKGSKKDRSSKKGSVCGDPDIRGEVLAPITSRTRGCGVDEPVRVTAISGIPFSQPATFDCNTAEALKTWINKGMRPAFGNREVVQLHIFGSYMCRTRNNVRGAKISEHGRGKAVDIAGFVFSDGKEWTVEHDYNKTIRKAQKAACGIFGTTLGPGSDGYHEDHLHFDTASYRNGSYCR